MSKSLFISSCTALSLALLLIGCGADPDAKATNSSVLLQQRIDPICDPTTDPNCVVNDPGGPVIIVPNLPPAHLNGLPNIVVYLDNLTAFETSDDSSGGLGNTRDEVYLQVQASTPQGIYGVRLPRRDDQEDYYSFPTRNYSATAGDMSSWINRDNAYMGKPIIYSGELADGQSMTFNVLILEQDNTNLGVTRSAIKAGLTASTPIAGTNPYGLAGIAAGLALTELIPDTTAGDVIGGFSLTIVNKAGNIEQTWLPIATISTAKGTAQTTMPSGNSYGVANSTATKKIQQFDMMGTGGASYASAAAVEIVSDDQARKEHPLKFLGEQNDSCGSDNLILNGVRIAKNETRATDVSLSAGDHWWNSGSYFHWTCDGVAEQTGPDGSTDYVIASHHGGVGDRDIHWYTFKTVEH